METDSGFLTRSYHCFVEWLTIGSNLVEYVLQFRSDERNATSSTQTFGYYPS